MSHRVQKTVSALQAQFTDDVVDVPVVQQRTSSHCANDPEGDEWSCRDGCRPTKKIQKTVVIPQLHFIDEVVVVPVVMR